MNVPSHRACDSVSPADERKVERRLLLFQIIGPEQVIVDLRLVTGLGPRFTAAAARNAKHTFAAVLAKLARQMAGGTTRQLSGRPAGSEDHDPLTLTPALSEKFLDELRELGAGLHGLLAKDFLEKAKSCGFPREGEKEEPALMFFELREPVLWEMMYGGKQVGEPRWQEFWGFRAPVTHWMIGAPSPFREIWVRNGLFSAISEDLCGTGREVSAVLAQLERRIVGVQHGSLARALHERAVAKGLLPADGPGLVPDWLRCPTSCAAEDHDRWKNQWKRAALTEIFYSARSRYELFHFACHGEAADGETELYSTLVLHIAGERLSLPVSLMTSDLQHPQPGAEPGPFVFLNACSTGQPNRTGEPPGFPASWVGYGALAVIATLCPVPDQFAHAFAAKFYEYLFEKSDGPGPARSCYLAEALLATRRFFMAPPYNNPLGLAYVLYGHERARVLSEGTPGWTTR